MHGAPSSCGNSETEFRLRAFRLGSVYALITQKIMPYRKPQKEAICFTIRIHDAKTLELINELTAKLGNRNAVLNDALKLGAPTLYARVFGKEVETEKIQSKHSPTVGRELKELRRGSDDIFIELAVIETMIAGLYNVKIAQLSGEDVNAESLIDGSMCDLPELVAGIKTDLIGATKVNGQ